MPADTRFRFVLCACGAPFQSGNFMRHRKSLKKLPKEEQLAHSIITNLEYCIACGVEVIPTKRSLHSKCNRVYVQKDIMKELLEKKELAKEVRERLICAQNMKVQQRQKRTKAKEDLKEKAKEEQKQIVGETLQAVSRPNRDDVDLDDNSSSSSSEDEEKVGDIKPLSKRMRLILSDSSSSESDIIVIEPLRSSSPISERGIRSQQPYDPRSQARAVSQTVAKNELTDLLEAAKKSRDEWREKAQSNLAKAQDYKRLEKQVISQRETLLKLREDKSSLEKQLETEKTAAKEQAKIASLLQKELDSEKTKRIEKDIREKDTSLECDTTLIHIKCRNGRMDAHHHENPNQLDTTSCCYLDRSSNTACHHVNIRPTAKGGFVVKLKNTRWPQ